MIQTKKMLIAILVQWQLKYKIFTNGISYFINNLIIFKIVDNNFQLYIYICLKRKIDFLRRGTRANAEIQAEDVAQQFIQVKFE